MTRRERLDPLADTILDPEAAPGALFQACQDLYELLLDVAGLRPEEVAPEVGAETLLPTGKAIAPIDAARCLLDLYRTQAFAGGVEAAIADRHRIDPTRPVRVLYAGCGPFATLLLPALTRFTPDEVRGTLIDLHQPSIDAVGTVISELGLAGFIDGIEMADATDYRIPDDARPDVLVVECLLRGLSAEPQVAITWNLAGQSGPEVALIPAEIRLDVVYAGDFARSMGPSRPLPRVAEEPIFRLSRDAAAGWGPYDPTAALPAGTVTIDRPVEAPERLALATTIRTHDGYDLGDYRSGLTHPLLLEHPASLAAGTELAFRYSLTKPGIEVAALR